MPDLMPSNALTAQVEALIRLPRPVVASGGQSGGQGQDLQRLGKMKASCADMESLFLGTLFKTMRQTVPEGGLLKKSAGSDLWESMFDQQISTALSQGEGIGVGQKIFGQMVRSENLEQLAQRTPNYKGLRYKITTSGDQINKAAPGSADGDQNRPTLRIGQGREGLRSVVAAPSRRTPLTFPTTISSHE